MRRLLALRRLLLSLLFAAAGSAYADDWNYTLRPGDDLWSIARLHCGSAAFAPRLAQHNQLTDPARLRAGARLRIPVDWLVKRPVGVTVVAVRGAVVDDSGQPVAAGVTLQMGARLLTADGFALVRFADGTELEVGTNSNVLFNVLTAHGESGMVDTHLRLYSGGGNVRVIRQGAASSFRVWTPTGIAAVRGTSFRLGVDAGLPDGLGSGLEGGQDAQPDPVSRLETLTGSVDYERVATTDAVPAGRGLIASASGVVTEALLPAPQFPTAGTLQLQANDMLRWSAVPGAASYRIDLFDLQGTVPILAFAQTLEEPVLDLHLLPAGRYGVAVRAVAISGLQGLDAERELLLEDARPEPVSAEQQPVAGALRWSEVAGAQGYVVELARDPSFADANEYEVQGKDLPLAATAAGVPGRYFWRVRTSLGPFSAVTQVDVLPPAITDLQISAGRFDGGRRARLQWTMAPGTSYRLSVLRQGVEIYSAVQASGATLPLETAALPVGDYETRLTPVAEGLEGPALAQPLSIIKPVPWWRAAVLLLPLLVL